MMEGELNLDDFLAQLQQMKKMGPLENLLEMLPGAGNVPARLKDGMAGVGDKDLKKSEAIIRSMTAQERRHPGVMDASRRRRIALGSGTEVRDVNELLKNFAQAKKMAQQLKKAQKRLLRFGK
jgi:signal recognition particle subunit SRP54